MTEHDPYLPSHRRRRLRTPQDVVQAIRARHHAGSDVLDLERQDTRLLNAAWRCFGGWREALVAADVVAADAEFRDTQRWWRQRVLELIRRRHEKGRSLDQKKNGNRGLVHAALLYFESWQAALAAAKVPEAENSPASANLDTSGSSHGPAHLD